jgi:integrase
MQPKPIRPVSGHVFVRNGARGVVWYAKWRDQHGQHQRRLGPVWPGKGAPPEGWFRPRTRTGRTPADVTAALEALLTEARRGALRQARSGVTFADAAEEWLRHGEHERGLKRSTMADYRSAVRAHLIPAFGRLPLEAVTSQSIERWRTEWLAAHGGPRTAAKLVTILHGIFERARRAYGLDINPAADVERLRLRYDPAAFDFYSPEEVFALARAAASEQDGAIYLTAAFSGLRRGELLALDWRDVDFDRRTIRVEGNYSHGQVVAPKSGKGRAVPLVPDVARALARTGQRERVTAPDDPVFCSEAGERLDGSALRRRYKIAQRRAGLRPLRFHDLRHTFGSLAINHASIVQVQAWMGHADIDTTMRYLHHRSRADEAELLAPAFSVPAMSGA